MLKLEISYREVRRRKKERERETNSIGKAKLNGRRETTRNRDGGKLAELNLLSQMLNGANEVDSLIVASHRLT